MNKLFLVHRPTQQYCMIATRDSFGWQPVRFDSELRNMLQRAANGLSLLPAGASQDDFVLIMDEAGGAPFAYDIFDWETYGGTVSPQMKLRPPLAFSGAGYEDAALTAQLKTLRAVLGDVEIDPGQAREMKAIDRLRRENAELRESAAFLAELVRLDRKAAALEGVTAEQVRGEWHVTWVKAQAWVAGLAERVRGWGL